VGVRGGGEGTVQVTLTVAMTTFYCSGCSCWGYVSYDNSEDTTVVVVGSLVKMICVLFYSDSGWSTLKHTWTSRICRKT